MELVEGMADWLSVGAEAGLLFGEEGTELSMPDNISFYDLLYDQAAVQRAFNHKEHQLPCATSSQTFAADCKEH